MSWGVRRWIPVERDELLCAVLQWPVCNPDRRWRIQQPGSILHVGRSVFLFGFIFDLFSICPVVVQFWFVFCFALCFKLHVLLRSDVWNRLLSVCRRLMHGGWRWLYVLVPVSFVLLFFLFPLFQCFSSASASLTNNTHSQRAPTGSVRRSVRTAQRPGRLASLVAASVSPGPSNYQAEISQNGPIVGTLLVLFVCLFVWAWFVLLLLDANA